MITIDGRSGYSRGVSLAAAARLANRLGATEAVNLDGGGSTTFVTHGRVRNRTSDGRERGVVNALALVGSRHMPYDPYYTQVHAKHHGHAKTQGKKPSGLRLPKL